MGEFSLSPQLRFANRSPASLPKVMFTTKPPPAADEETTKDLVIIAGGQATFITLNHTFSSQMNKQIQTEKKRTSDLVRIKNPENPQQHVDVKRPQEITTTPQAGQTGRNLPTSMKVIYMPQPKDTPNVEVIQEGIKEENPNWSEGGGSAAP